MIEWIEKAIDFSNILNISITASWLILVVIGLRLVFKKAPKWVNVALWGIVALRLLMPFSIESSLSLVPSVETVSDQLLQAEPEYSHGDAQLDILANPNYGSFVSMDLDDSMDSFQWSMVKMSLVWYAGIAAMSIYTVMSFIILRRKLRTAVILRGNLYQCETVSSPFVLGILKPKIYLPYGMDDQNLSHVIAHEQAHIRRKDHWWKPLGFLLLTIHWFNPLMWVAYILLCRDIELACDEKVIAELGNEQRADYTQALVACAVNRRMIAACPLAFGEVGVKERIKSVMNYKKPAFWIIVAALVVCVVVAVCFLTDPNPSREFSMSGNNVSNLNPEAIVERILDIEDITNSGVHTNSMNFSLQVDSDFNWADSQAVSYFFKKSKTTYKGQLRIFPNEEKYFLTEPSEGQTQERIFLLRHYLEAIKYLPQEAIRQMAPADRYIIQHREEGRPSDYERMITYTPDGVKEIEGWNIHLEIQPLHADGDSFNGLGEEVLHVFYGSNGNFGDRSQFDQLQADRIVVSRIDLSSGVKSDVTITDKITISLLLSMYKSVEVEDYSRPMNDERIMLQFFSGDNMILDWYVSCYEEDDEIVTCGDMFGLGNKRVVGEFDYDWLLSLCAYTDIEFTGNRNLGLKAEIIDIDYDQKILYVKDIDESAAVFGDRCAIDCSYAINRDNLIYVNYSEFNDVCTITFEDFEVGDSIIIALYDSEKDNAFNSSAIAEQIQLGTQKFPNHTLSGMEPTRTNLRGFYCGYLFVPINGATFRYEMTNIDPNTVNAGDFLLTFTEETHIEGIVWEVYSLKEYADMSKVIAISGTNSACVYEYAPAMQTEEGALEAAREAGYVIIENGYLTDGSDTWKEFFDKTQEGKHATVFLAQYYTLDPERTAPTTYEALKQDYPALYIHELSYDGDKFVLRTESDVKVYEYLMKYEASGTPLAGNTEHKRIVHYALTHDVVHTWEELWGSLVSSASPAAIDFYPIYAERDN